MPKYLPVEEDLIGERIIRNFEFLYRLVNTRSKKQRWNLIKNATRDEILAIVEVFSNIKKGNFLLSDKKQRVLEENVQLKEFLHKLSRVRTPKSAKLHIQVGEGISIYKDHRGNEQIRVNQRGLGLPFFLVPVLAQLAISGGEALLSKIING